jgi:microcystin-dependent protein
MADYFIGEILFFAGNYIPDTFVECNGASLNINQYQSLFSLIGVTYGGDGVNTFKVPDLRGLVTQGVGASGSALGEVQGVGSVSLAAANLPPHNHFLMGSTQQATQSTINGNVLASTASNILAYNNIQGPTANVRNLSPKALSNTGQSLPHNNVMPTTSARFCICVLGIYPSFV